VLARRYDVPLVYDAQELYTGIHTLPRLYRAALVLQERVLIRRAQRTIAVNDAIRDEMERRYKVKIDAVVLNCPPLVEDLGDGSLTVRQLLDLPDDVPVLLYSGSLGPQRGLENTMRALEHLEHACLVLLGDGPLRTDLEEQAVDWGLDDRVFFVPFIHHLDVPSFIASADIGIIPYENVGVNHYLCSPSKLFHYIMAGLPVACSDFPFLRRVVLDNGIGAVFDPGDPLAIAGAVHRLTDAPDAYRACKQRLELARKRYCWEEQETLFMSVYRSLPMHALTVPATSVRVGAA
jgi:glycosyltransferase involved in cell wall biosynthesis